VGGVDLSLLSLMFVQQIKDSLGFPVGNVMFFTSGKSSWLVVYARLVFPVYLFMGNVIN